MASGSEPLGDDVGSNAALVLETPNPLDLSVSELEELAADLQRVMDAKGLSGVSVRARANEPFGAGNQLTDYLFIFLPNAEFLKETAFNALIGAAIVFMRKRFKRKHESRRLRQIDVYGPDGKLRTTFRLTSEEAEPEQSDPGGDWKDVPWARKN
jgi:hypothetical protein